MAYSTSPIAGIQLGEIVKATAPEKDFTKLGLRVIGDDGRDYILAEASAAVATAGTDVILTEPGMTFAAGAGQWETVAAGIASGDYAWLRKLALDAIV